MYTDDNELTYENIAEQSTLISQRKNRVILNALSHLQNLNLSNKETLQKLASFAQYDDPEIMAELLNILCKKLDYLNNKWVFASIGFALWTSVLKQAPHFVRGRQSLPVDLLGRLIQAAEAIHTGENFDRDKLYLSLLAINACITILQASEISKINNTIYKDTQSFLEKTLKENALTPTLIFLLEQTLKQLYSIKIAANEDTKKSSIKNETGKGICNFGLALLYFGSGTTSLIVAAGAIFVAPLTLLGSAPVAAASVFGFGLLIGLGVERTFDGIKNIKLIGRKISERDYFHNLKEYSSTDLKELTNQDFSFESFFAVVIQQIKGNSKLSTLEQKQLIFSIFQLLKYVEFSHEKITILLDIIKAIYKENDDLAKVDGVGQFLFEQLQQFKEGNYLKQTEEEPKEDYCLSLISQLTKEISRENTSIVARYLNSTSFSNYYEINFEVDNIWGNSLEKKPMNEDYLSNLSLNDESLKEYEVTLACLNSQRMINKIRLNLDEIQNCKIVPATPDGNCAFMAISRCLELNNKMELINNQPLTRANFIQTIQDHYSSEEDKEYKKDLIEAIFKEDEANSLEEWCNKFQSTSLYVGEPHLRFLSYLYGLSFEIFAIDDSNNLSHEPSFEKIQATQYANNFHEIQTIYLAHIVAGERNHYPNHFEGIIIQPSQEQIEIVEEWLNEVIDNLKQKMNPPHVLPKQDINSNSSVLVDFRDLRQSKYGLIDKSIFMVDFWEQERGFSLLRPRRFGKSITLSMCEYFFSIQYAAISDKLFSDLNIASYYPQFYKIHRGKYPFIKIDLKDVTGSSLDGILHAFQFSVVNESYKKYIDILCKSESLKERDKNLINNYSDRLIRLEEVELIKAIKILTELLHQHYRERVIIVVDEYDSPLIKAKQNKTFQEYEQLKNFIASFFSETFKNNPYVTKFFFTGIMDAKGTGIFSELNSINTFTLLNDKLFAPYLGFSEEEVILYLRQNGIYPTSEQLKSLKEYYNGYVCLSGDTDISSDLYNIYSISQYVQFNGTLDSYWVKSSSSHQLFLDLIIGTGDILLMKEILNLMGGYPVIKCYLQRPTELEERGIYFFIDNQAVHRLKARVIHYQDGINSNYEDILIPTNFPLQEKIYAELEKQVDLFVDLSFEDYEKLVYYTKEYCIEPAKDNGFSVKTKLTLQNLKFLDQINGNSREDIYGLLFYAGYLTFTGKYEKQLNKKLFDLKIPNIEIRQMFNQEIQKEVYASYQTTLKKSNHLTANTSFFAAPLSNQFANLSLSDSDKEIMELVNLEDLDFWKAQCKIVNKISEGNEKIATPALKSALSYFETFLQVDIDEKITQDTRLKLQQYVDLLKEVIDKKAQAQKSFLP